MEPDHHRIKRLYLERLTGVISREDDALLADLLRYNLEAKSIWTSLEAEYEALEIETLLSKTDPGSELNALKRRRFLTPPKVGWSWLMAASLLLSLGLGYYFLGSNGTISKSNPPLASRSASPKIQLISSDGQTLNLDTLLKKDFTFAGHKIQSKGREMTIKDIANGNYGLNTLIVPIKETYNLVLSDGTKVSLNSDSKLRFPFSFNAKNREVYLEGEAYFEVAKNVKQPFVVHTVDNDITVTGTRFNVNSYHKGNVKTDLLEGGVSITSKSKEKVILKPGMTADFEVNRGFVTTTFENEDITSWRYGVYYFNNKRLGDLKSVISRWYGYDMQFEEAGFADIKVSGLLERDQVADFLKDLQTTSGLRHRLNGDDLILY